MIDVKSYGPWAIVAGASEGIGVSFAHELGRAGFNLVLVARQKSLLQQVAHDVSAASSAQVRVLALDLSCPDMLGRVRDVTDDIDVGLVICNAGASTGTRAFLDASLEDVLQAVRLGPTAYVSLVHHFGSKMAARGRGGIILMGSLAGNAGAAGVVFYSAAKAFAQVLAEGLWSELKPRGVDVLYSVLGATRTPSRARAGITDTPGQFVAEPDDVARECLDNIANGPVLVPAYLEDAFKYFSSLPRRQAAETMSNLLRSFQKQPGRD